MQSTLARWLNIKWPLDQKGAQGCLLLNLIAWPGLGSVLARRKCGIIQMLLSLAGLFSMVFGLQRFMAMIWEETRYPTWKDDFVWLGIGGVSAFAFSWLWALFTSFSIRKSVPKASAPVAAPVTTPPSLPPRI